MSKTLFGVSNQIGCRILNGCLSVCNSSCVSVRLFVCFGLFLFVLHFKLSVLDGIIVTHCFYEIEQNLQNLSVQLFLIKLMTVQFINKKSHIIMGPKIINQKYNFALFFD